MITKIKNTILYIIAQNNGIHRCKSNKTCEIFAFQNLQNDDRGSF